MNNRRKIHIILSILALSVIFLNQPARAQHASTITQQRHDLSFSAGRDFWLAEMSNNWESGNDLYMRLYITSTKNTTAYIAFDGRVDSIAITANTQAQFTLPDSIQMESSGIVENKAIHIWSNDAPLVVYNMNHAEGALAGEYVIPTIGWGTDYVIAAYGSDFEGFEDTYDYPSECAVVAEEDSTTVEITPSCDCRQSMSGNDAGDANSAIVVYPQGVLASFALNKGQSLELFPVKATGPDNFDLTGSIVHANHPVGVLGGVSYSNIPANFPNGNHIEDMIPPARTWGETYYGTNFYRKDSSQVQYRDDSNSWGLYLFVASEPNQYIYVHTCVYGDYVADILPNTYSFGWVEYEESVKFYSPAPFQCVEYSNSNTYPDGNNGSGGPADANLNPGEQFLQNVQFQISADGDTNANFVDITMNAADEGKVRLDSAVLHNPVRCIDGNWVIETIDSIRPGVYTISGGDSGVSAHVYTFANNGKAYSWSSEMFEGTFQSPDTAPPVAQISGGGLSDSVIFADTGASASLLAALWVDSISNSTFTLDTSWHEGVPRASSYFTWTGTGANSYLRVTAYDFAGNSTTVTLPPSPSKVASMPSVSNLATLQTSDGRMIQAIVPSAWMNPVRVDLLNILGQTVYSGSIPGSSTFDAGALPRGVYFWRVESSGQSQIGKILLGE